MAIGAAAVAYVRAGGNDANGAFYDGTIAGAGAGPAALLDSNTPAVTITHLSCLLADSAGRTKVRDADGNGFFNSNHIGYAIYIPATGSFTADYYFITAIDSGDLITLDRSPAGGADRTGGTGRVGGAAATIKRVCDNANTTGKCVSGNTIYIRGADPVTDTPSSDTYTFTGYFTPVSGNVSSGRTKLIGYNGRPRIKCDGLTFYSADLMRYEGLYLTVSSNSNGGFGVVNGNNLSIYNCVIDTANQTGTVGAVGNGEIVNCEIKGGRSASSSGGYGISSGNYHTRIIGCYIHETGDHGVLDASGMTEIQGCIIYKAFGNSIHLNAGATQFGISITRNTLDNGQGHGIYITDSTALYMLTAENNIISNHVQTGKYGINVAAGSLALNDRLKGTIDYNVFYRCGATPFTSYYNGISGGAHDTVGVDPGYVSVPGNWTPGSAMDGLAFPGQFLNANGSISYIAPGAVQRQISGGGGLPPRIMQVVGPQNREY